MTSDFLLSWKQLNFFHLEPNKQTALTAPVISKKITKNFEYSQEDGY